MWATSLVLLDHLHSKPFSLNGLRVLEIGCGWGLLGVYLAKTENCQVTCTDIDPSVLPIAQMHAELNAVKIKTKTASFTDIDKEFLKNFDVIIGAEVCYSDEIAQELNALIKNAAAAKVKHLLIADPGRPDFDDCLKFCEQHYSCQKILLPGSINGKITTLLSVTFDTLKN